MSEARAGKSKNRLYYFLAAPFIGAVIGYFASTIKPPGSSPLFQLPRWLMFDPSLQTFGPYLAVCIIPWCLFAIYWETAAKNAAQTKSSETRFSRLIHVLLVNIALLIELIPIVGLGRFVPAMP